MAYRYENNINGEQDLVIDGFEKGIATSPFTGIGNIRNLNIKYYEGVAYVNYKRQSCTLNGGTMGAPLYACQSPAGIIYIADGNRQIWKQDSVNGSSFTILTGNYSQPINGLSFWMNYLIVIGGDLNGKIEICGDGSGDGGVTSSNWNSSPQSTVFTVTIASPAVFTSNNHGLSVGDNITLITSGSLPTGLSINTNYYVIATGLTANNFEISTTAGGSAVNTSGSQSGVQQFFVARGLWPIPNQQTVSMTAGSSPVFPTVGSTTGSIGSYTDPSGTTRTVWNGVTGQYNMKVTQAAGLSQTVLAQFTQGSSNVSWTPALTSAATSTNVLVFYNGNTSISTGIEHQSIVASNNGDLYFCNGSNIGAFTLNVNNILDKNNMNTFSFDANILSLPPTETSTWLTELRNQLIVLGKYKLYQWDFTSQFWVNPLPIDEQMVKGINILNTVYIFAGNKGDVYIYDGTNIKRLFRMSDYISGLVDPSWNVGGIMQHRQRLYFQMVAKNGQTNAVVLAGIFSYDLDTHALNMENQNSGGLIPAGMTNNGLLIDDSDTSINYDKYYSSYGATTSSIDFNDTTLYSNNEAVIETDIVPVGTFLQNKTFQSAEFKLDQPLKSGDSISLYIRPSLADSFTLLGTTTTSTLSGITQKMPIQNMEWAQFKVTLSCNATSTSSSFNRLRELRIR